MDSMFSTNYRNDDLYSSAGTHSNSENSGWSFYIEDFLASNYVKDPAVSFGSEFTTIFSDATLWDKNLYPNDDFATFTRSIYKRRKTEETFIDHDLEDTAISPVSSSKVDDFEKLCVKLGRTGYDLNVEQPRGHDCGAASQDKREPFYHTDEVLHSSFTGKDASYNGLREKGLCLVPVSMLFNML